MCEYSKKIGAFPSYGKLEYSQKKPPAFKKKEGLPKSCAKATSLDNVS
jgi:hypothetical protein